MIKIDYIPDNWILLKFDTEKHGVFYKVLAGWSGGYLDGDSWRLNSGVSRVEETDTHYLFYGYSGSCYKCNKHSEFGRMNIQGILKQLLDTGCVTQVETKDYVETINEKT